MKYTDFPDQSLVMLTLAGEQAAYEMLVRRHQSAAIITAASVTHDSMLAEDAVQDAFVAAWMKLDKLQDPSRFRPWLLRIVRNCACSMMARYRSYVSFDELEDCLPDMDDGHRPDLWYAAAEENAALHASMERLPVRVREIIRMYYFEDLSVSEIAVRLHISAGTVKSHLHDGRNKIRKDLGAMDQNTNDAMYVRVMKKVEELKAWKLRCDKTGFEEVYRDVLADVEQLPESRQKHHALADVLACGYWWMPGQKQDDLLARIKEAALAGCNDEVMKFITAREADKMYYTARAAWYKDVLIPSLDAQDFPLTVGSAWITVASLCKRQEQNFPQEAYDALDRALSILPRHSLEYWNAKNYRRVVERLTGELKDIGERFLYLYGGAVELRRATDRESLLCWDENGSYAGDLESIDFRTVVPLGILSWCDGYLIRGDLKVGDTYIATDGKTLTLVEDTACVDTPAGRFEGCRHYVIDALSESCAVWFKEGVGMVRYDHTRDGYAESRVLCQYSVTGTGYFPLAVGNHWAYTGAGGSAMLEHTVELRVEYAEDDRALVGIYAENIRRGYDENDWSDMVQRIASEYFDGRHVVDVSHAVERAEALAETPIQKAHTSTAASVARRIMACDAEFNPAYTHTGHWNFFRRETIAPRNGRLYLSEYNCRWSFELKSTNSSLPFMKLLNSDLLGILSDTTTYIWSEEWVPGYRHTMKYLLWNLYALETSIACDTGEPVTTPAGTFDDCMTLTVETSGFPKGMEYRNGKRIYTYARGVGLVRVEHTMEAYISTSVYELTAYQGTGEGYFPQIDGMTRRYDAPDLTDGYIGWVAYSFHDAGDGKCLCFVDQCGIRRKPEAITDYSAIQGEVHQVELERQGKYEEAKVRARVNDLARLLHQVTADYPHIGRGEVALTHYQLNESILKAMGGGEVPEAFLGICTGQFLLMAAASIGCGRTDEGYRLLDRCFDAIRRWNDIPEGTLLSVGADDFFDGLRMIKGKPILVHKDGQKEYLPIAEAWSLKGKPANTPYQVLNGHLWAWFSPEWDTPRFKEYVQKAKELAGV